MPLPSKSSSAAARRRRRRRLPSLPPVAASAAPAAATAGAALVPGGRARFWRYPHRSRRPRPWLRSPPLAPPPSLALPWPPAGAATAHRSSRHWPPPPLAALLQPLPQPRQLVLPWPLAAVPAAGVACAVAPPLPLAAASAAVTAAASYNRPRRWPPPLQAVGGSDPGVCAVCVWMSFPCLVVGGT